MPTAAHQSRYTPADVARLSDQTDNLYELIDGDLVAKEVVLSTSYVTSSVAFILGSAYPSNGAYVVCYQLTFCFDDENRNGLRPNVALVWPRRMPDGLTDEDLFIPPDLAVEVAGRSTLYTEQQRRVNMYLRAGVPVVWVIDPFERTMHIYRGLKGPVDYLRDGDNFADESLLPGLRFEIGQILPPLKSAAATA